jgi:hypothetical protein
LLLDGSPVSLNGGWDETVVEGGEHYGGCEIDGSERRVVGFRPNTTGHKLPPRTTTG